MKKRLVPESALQYRSNIDVSDQHILFKNPLKTRLAGQILKNQVGNMQKISRSG
jgi:hypothetical protein